MKKYASSNKSLTIAFTICLLVLVLVSWWMGLLIYGLLIIPMLIFIPLFTSYFFIQDDVLYRHDSSTNMKGWRKIYILKLTEIDEIEVSKSFWKEEKISFLINGSPIFDFRLKEYDKFLEEIKSKYPEIEIQFSK